MSQKNLDIIRGLMQAAADSYDGALDDKGNPIKVGLKREEGHPVLDSRTMDGFKCRIDGARLIVTYQSELLLRDVYSGNLEKELEQTMAAIVKHLKKRYKQITGKTIKLTADGEVDALVQSTSRIRIFVNAIKKYNIDSLKGVENPREPDEPNLDKKFRKFLGLSSTKG
tara:strand:+ start:195 stop:701 length:507 start_codon:yes stop_codon:yes gene_type:complete